VVKVLDFVPDPATDRDWIVMEALSGTSLAATMPITLDRARHVARHLLAALSGEAGSL
jgi:hypothetical protein